MPPEIFNAPASRHASADEQDQAAGGREARTLALPDGSVATVSVYLHKGVGSRRAYAYVRFKHGGRNRRRYVGDVSAETRAEALAAAWKLIQEKGLLTDWSTE